MKNIKFIILISLYFLTSYIFSQTVTTRTKWIEDKNSDIFVGNWVEPVEIAKFEQEDSILGLLIGNFFSSSLDTTSDTLVYFRRLTKGNEFYYIGIASKGRRLITPFNIGKYDIVIATRGDLGLEIAFKKQSNDSVSFFDISIGNKYSSIYKKGDPKVWELKLVKYTDERLTLFSFFRNNLPIFIFAVFFFLFGLLIKAKEGIRLNKLGCLLFISGFIVIFISIFITVYSGSTTATNYLVKFLIISGLMFIFADFIYNLYRNLKFGYSSDSEGYKESAFSYLQSGQTKKALKDISIAIKLSKNEILDSDRAQLFYERSKIRRSIGDKNGALTDLSWAIYINPRDIEMYKERLILREEIGDIKGAEQDSATIKSMREVIMNYRELPNLSFLEKERPIREPQKGISTTKAALGGAFAGTIYGIIKSHKKWKDKEEKKKGKKSK